LEMPAGPRERRLATQNTLSRQIESTKKIARLEERTHARKVDLPQSGSPRSKIVTVGVSPIKRESGWEVIMTKRTL
jgi:hypothetical protein